MLLRIYIIIHLLDVKWLPKLNKRRTDYLPYLFRKSDLQILLKVESSPLKERKKPEKLVC